jgi:hypothetical protein
MNQFPALPEGCFSGRGINHEGQNFTGALALRRIAGGYLLWFRAQGDGGEVFHEESVLIAQHQAGGFAMTSLNTNFPGLQSFTGMVTDSGLVFSHGDVATMEGFRETVTISIKDDHAVSYSFDWAMHGQPLEARSAVIMRPIINPPTGCPLSF